MGKGAGDAVQVARHVAAPLPTLHAIAIDRNPFRATTCHKRFAGFHECVIDRGGSGAASMRISMEALQSHGQTLCRWTGKFRFTKAALVGVKRKKHYVIGMCDVRAFYDNADPPGVTGRLDPKSGLPDFGIKLSKSETSDFDAIQYSRSVVTRSPGQAGR